jgi:hypothetical protein
VAPVVAPAAPAAPGNAPVQMKTVAGTVWTAEEATMALQLRPLYTFTKMQADGSFSAHVKNALISKKMKEQGYDREPMAIRHFFRRVDMLRSDPTPN